MIRLMLAWHVLNVYFMSYGFVYKINNISGNKTYKVLQNMVGNMEITKHLENITNYMSYLI